LAECSLCIFVVDSLISDCDQWRIQNFCKAIRTLLGILPFRFQPLAFHKTAQLPYREPAMKRHCLISGVWRLFPRKFYKLRSPYRWILGHPWGQDEDVKVSIL